MKALISIATTLALAAAAASFATPAGAVEPTNTPTSGGHVSRADVSASIDALSSEGKVVDQYRASDGERVSTIDLGSGAAVTVTEPAPARTRLSGGKDSGGFFVSFTNTDQAIIMGGGAAFMTAGLCAILAVPTAGIGCGVVTAIMVVVTGFVTSNAGSCPGGKSLRVWVTNTGARNPRCV